MHPVLALPLRADDVCAYLWARADQSARAAACARAHVSDAASLLDWYELGKAERIPLALALVDEITTSASQQRAATGSLTIYHRSISEETGYDQAPT